MNENSDKTSVEKNYNAHANNPGPSPEALEEKSDKGAGWLLFWIIVAISVILTIAWLFF